MRAALILWCLALAACASISDVMPMADGSYFVQAEDNILAFRGRSTMTEDAMERATEFCAERKQIPVLVSENNKGVRLLSSAESGIVFRCVDQASKPATQ